MENINVDVQRLNKLSVKEIQLPSGETRDTFKVKVELEVGSDKMSVFKMANSRNF